MSCSGGTAAAPVGLPLYAGPGLRSSTISGGVVRLGGVRLSSVPGVVMKSVPPCPVSTFLLAGLALASCGTPSTGAATTRSTSSSPQSNLAGGRYPGESSSRGDFMILTVYDNPADTVAEKDYFNSRGMAGREIDILVGENWTVVDYDSSPELRTLKEKFGCGIFEAAR